MIKVSIADRQSRLKIDRRWFRDLVRHSCESEEVADARIGLAFVDDPTIHDLNKRFLAHDYPTDVLTFPMGSGKTLEGEIVLSTDYAAQECAEYGWPDFMEASLYVVHGILHLCGYDDDDEASSEKMKARQQSILEGFARGHEPYSATEFTEPMEASD